MSKLAEINSEEFFKNTGFINKTINTGDFVLYDQYIEYKGQLINRLKLLVEDSRAGRKVLLIKLDQCTDDVNCDTEMTCYILSTSKYRSRTVYKTLEKFMEVTIDDINNIEGWLTYYFKRVYDSGYSYSDETELILLDGKILIDNKVYALYLLSQESKKNIIDISECKWLGQLKFVSLIGKNINTMRTVNAKGMEVTECKIKEFHSLLLEGRTFSFDYSKIKNLILRTEFTKIRIDMYFSKIKELTIDTTEFVHINYINNPIEIEFSIFGENSNSVESIVIIVNKTVYDTMNLGNGIIRVSGIDTKKTPISIIREQ